MMKVLQTFSIIFVFSIFFTLEARECSLGAPIKSFHPKYASHFSIDYYKSFKIVHVDNDQYLLSKTGDIGCEISLPKIITPVKKVVMMSTTYLPSLEMLKVQNSLVGFSGIRYIVSKTFDLKHLKEVSFKLNPESLMSLKSDLIMAYDSNLTSSKQKEIFNSLKLPVVLNRDYEEKTPLGRAEWIIYIASFYDKDEEALKIFNSINENYLNLKAENLKKFKSTKKPKVLVGEIQNGYWVTCGGESDLSQMITDAGGELLFYRPSSETQKISLEVLSQNNMPVDAWLTHNMWESKKDMESDFKKDKRYSLIKAQAIYNNNLVINEVHSNDYWETAMQRPDLLLKDLTSILHPETNSKRELRWYRQL